MRVARAAQQRLIFEEFLLFQAGLVLRKRQHAARSQAASRGRGRSDSRIGAQGAAVPADAPGRRTRCVKSSRTCSGREPMNRLLQGDVGAGKTIVALLAALVAMENGLQVAFMAPTEILADQHYLTIRRLLDQSRFRVAPLTGSVDAARSVARCWRNSPAERCIWSSARTRSSEEAVAFHALGLVVIDEQHRFGVVQRATLRAKGAAARRARDDRHADSADARADGVRRSRRVRDSRSAARAGSRSSRWREPESRRDEVYRLVRRELEQGRQVYVIYPLVEESSNGSSLRAATAMADHLQAGGVSGIQGRRCCTAA